MVHIYVTLEWAIILRSTIYYYQFSPQNVSYLILYVVPEITTPIALQSKCMKLILFNSQVLFLMRKIQTFIFRRHAVKTIMMHTTNTHMHPCLTTCKHTEMQNKSSRYIRTYIIILSCMMLK